MSSFDRLATETASTKRSPGISEGRRGEPTTQIASLSCTPLDPVDAEIRERLALDAPHELLQTFVTGAPDIREGDILVYGSVEYPIRSCAEWKWRDTTYLHLVVEEIKDGRR